MIEIQLPPSKSVALRLLTLYAASGNHLTGEEWDFCDDTAALRKGLLQKRGIVHAGAGAAPLRFMIAYFAASEGAEVVLTGGDRLMERPILPLIDALRAIGADISLEPKAIRIKGKNLKSNKLKEFKLDLSLSSQFGSALILSSPLLPPFVAEFTSRPASLPYLKMSARMIQAAGSTAVIGEKDMRVSTHNPLSLPKAVVPEADWSAASYFYELALLNPFTPILLRGLLSPEKSLQGDSACCRIFSLLGVNTKFTPEGAIIEYIPIEKLAASPIRQDMSSVPDLVPAVALSCLIVARPFILTGVHTLRFKESDRIASIISGCKKMGYFLQSDADTLSWDGSKTSAEPHSVISTCEDHRIAMAFAPVIAASGADLRLDNKEVVRKSFPEFFKFSQPLLPTSSQCL